MVRQYTINVMEIKSFSQVSDLLDSISFKRKERIERFYFDKDKIHSLFGELILRYALWEQFHITTSNISIGYTAYGKPYLEGYEHIYFNLSHSGNWVLVGIGDVPLGVDVEQVNDNNILIVSKSFTEEEKMMILEKDGEEKKRIFYQLWTLKESYVKAIGKGLSIPFDSFGFRLYKCHIELYVNEIHNKQYTFRVGNLDEQHITALCVEQKGATQIENNVKILSLQHIQKWREMMKADL